MTPYALATFLLAFAAACDLPPPDVEVQQKALVPDTTSMPSHYATRVRRIDRGWRCQVWCEPSSEYGAGHCQQHCADTPTSVILAKDSADAAIAKPFGAYLGGASHQQYLGCGPQAIQNLMAYYGRYETLEHIYRFTGTVYKSSSQIATTPLAMENSIEDFLGDWDPNLAASVDVHNYSSLELVKLELLAGRPPIVQVNGGDHWVLVTGWREPQTAGANEEFFVVDYAQDSGEWKQARDLRFYEFDGWVKQLNHLFFGIGDWLPATVLTTRVSDTPSSPYTCPAYGPCDYGAWDPVSCSCR